MDIEINYPIGTKVKITQKDETGIGTGAYKVSTNFGVVSGYFKYSIHVELTSGTLVDNPNYNHKHVFHPVDHPQCTTEIIN